MALFRAGVVAMALGLTVAAAPRPTGQTPTPAPSATGFILGRAIDPDGKPVSNAELSLDERRPAATPNGAAAGARARVLSDGDGYFLFRDLPKGDYTFTGSKPGYVTAVYGRRSSTETGTKIITLADGERRADVSITFWKYAAVSGTVVDEAGEPLIGVAVRVLRRTVLAGRPVLTTAGSAAVCDDRGVFRAASLAPGDYVVGVVSTQATVPTVLQSYLADSLQRTGSTAAASQELGRSAQAVIPGFGIPGQRIGAWLLAIPFGRQQPTLPPVAGGRAFVYPTMFFPNVPVPSRATLITLGSGEEREGVDFQLRPVPTSSIAGTLTGPDGPEAFMSLSLLPAGADLDRDSDLVTATTVTDPTGIFMFLGVPAGSYTLQAMKVPVRPTNPGVVTTVVQSGAGGTITSFGPPGPTPPLSDEPTLWATLPISVEDRDIAGLAVSLTTGARLMGKVEFTGAPPAEDALRRIVPQVVPADRTITGNEFIVSRGVVEASGQFKTYELMPGRYVLRGQVDPPGWFFDDATLNGRDISDAPFDLKSEDIGNIVMTYANQQTKLSGSVHTTTGPDAAAAVIAFPAQPEFWVNYGTNPRRLKVGRASTTGAYSITGLPAGDYLVVAVHSDLPADWMDVTYLRRVAGTATRLTLSGRESRSLDLTSVEVR